MRIFYVGDLTGFKDMLKRKLQEHTDEAYRQEDIKTMTDKD